MEINIQVQSLLKEHNKQTSKLRHNMKYTLKHKTIYSNRTEIGRKCASHYRAT